MDLLCRIGAAHPGIRVGVSDGLNTLTGCRCSEYSRNGIHPRTGIAPAQGRSFLQPEGFGIQGRDRVETRGKRNHRRQGIAQDDLVRDRRVPVQTGFVDTETPTLTGRYGLMIMVIVFDVAGLFQMQPEMEEVITHFTWSPFKGMYAKVGLSAPAGIPLTIQ